MLSDIIQDFLARLKSGNVREVQIPFSSVTNFGQDADCAERKYFHRRFFCRHWNASTQRRCANTFGLAITGLYLIKIPTVTTHENVFD
jgi:hypothetical protein